MADVEVYARFESNIEHLNAGSIRHLLRRFVEELVAEGERLLRLNVPKLSGETERHVDKTEVEQIDEVIRAAFGIRPIEIENRRYQVGTKDLFTPGEQDSSNYPVFVNRGSGIFGPASVPIHSRRAHVMRFDVSEGTIFRSEVKGQRGQEFLLKTYEELRRVILPEKAKLFAERVRALATTPTPS